jgi:hypothetical protein
MKLLVDMNLGPQWIPFLDQQGFEATHWSVLVAATAPESAPPRLPQPPKKPKILGNVAAVAVTGTVLSGAAIYP